MHTSPHSIDHVAPAEAPILLSQLTHLLQDAFASGATLGFLPPVSPKEAQQYWRTVCVEVAQHQRVLLVARQAGQIVGSVQLALAMNPNAWHRAEVQKLLVLSSHRRQGIGRALMQEVEQAAREAGRTLLVLNTVEGEAAEQLYRTLGYAEVGVIPGYGQSASGLRDMALFYKALLPGE